MDIGVQIPYSLAIALQDPLKRRDGLRVETAAAPSIIGRTALRSIAVNVHVGESGAGALDVDYPVGREAVAAIRETWGNVRPIRPRKEKKTKKKKNPSRKRRKREAGGNTIGTTTSTYEPRGELVGTPAPASQVVVEIADVLRDISRRDGVCKQREDGS